MRGILQAFTEWSDQRNRRLDSSILGHKVELRGSGPGREQYKRGINK